MTHTTDGAFTRPTPTTTPAKPTPQTQHTPGPWDWDQGDDGTEHSHPYCSVSVDGGNLIIAEINDRFSREIGRANARLIAAAPETAAERDRLKAVNAQLLEALKAALVPFDDPTRNPSGLPIGEPSWCAEARAAIKAATEG